MKLFPKFSRNNFMFAKSIMNRFYRILILATHFICAGIDAQQAYFVDGYHGGIYGHYPLEWQTQFMVDNILRHPEWKICLEIEPETWDSVRRSTPQAYNNFKTLITNNKRIEFTNPTYAQPYCYNISGESLIRQFEYGIEKIHKHFPRIEFVTYSAEEPCFTGCMPQILKSFGFRYAVLKNPNTCWGGYTRAYGGELVNWIGSDGSSILTVPRYACEEFEENSTWQTKAWCNSKSYLDACFNYGIEHPVGMCFQDAGWKNGPWLGTGKNIKNNSIYTTWRNYFENISAGKTDDDWHFSQEDVLVSLMWGSQILQKIAQQVRIAENKIVMAEKMATIANIENNYVCPQDELDEAWRTLMLAQHHDAWIVPYNRLHKYGTWADAVSKWTDSTNDVADKIIREASCSFNKGNKTSASLGYIKVYNTLGVKRSEVVSLLLPREFADVNIKLNDVNDKEIVCWAEKGEGEMRIFFHAEVPPFGYTTYRILRKNSEEEKAQGIRKLNDSEWVMENDRYKIIIDASRGGTIKNLIAKKMGNKDFVKQTSEKAFGELRGYFYEEGKFYSSTDAPATINILRDNLLVKSVKIEGEIASHPFTQIITIVQGQDRIDFDLTIHWKNNVGIGEYKQGEEWRENRRAFYDDRFKLNVLFPAELSSPRLYKDAPFDVCESKLDNTFFQTWDQIKHNVILRWVDLVESTGNYALALFSDHTTSYSYGENFPLGLTLQYSGIGLWGVNYKITRPLRVKYAVVPHRERWDKASVSTKNDCWNEPLLCEFYTTTAMDKKSLINFQKAGYQICAARILNDGIVIRLFNAEGDDSLQKVIFDFPLSSVDEIDLRGNVIENKTIKKNRYSTEMKISIPRFGVKTFLIKK